MNQASPPLIFFVTLMELAGVGRYWQVLAGVKTGGTTPAMISNETYLLAEPARIPFAGQVLERH